MYCNIMFVISFQRQASQTPAGRENFSFSREDDFEVSRYFKPLSILIAVAILVYKTMLNARFYVSVLSVF